MNFIFIKEITVSLFLQKYLITQAVVTDNNDHQISILL